ncbi:MAG: hypothetical protein OHK006_22730 [Thermodesulfovibrionales bacterium]
MAQPRSGKIWVVYLLACRGNRLYTGVTNDLSARLQAHRSGRGSKFVRSFRPFALAGSVVCPDATAARSLEARIKRMRRADKLRFLEELPAYAPLHGRKRQAKPRGKERC